MALNSNKSRLGKTSTLFTLISFAAICGLPGKSPLAAQTSLSSQVPRKASLLGHVVDAENKPVSGAHVVVESLDRTETSSARTDAAGDFTLSDLSSGKYTVQVDRPPLRSKVFAVTTTDGTTQALHVTLDTRSDISPLVYTAATPSSDEPQFSDKPNFTVAGVTDWTAVGGHGSDATLRTSEDLARATVALTRSKSQGSEADGSIQRHSENDTEASLRAALNKNPASYSANRELGLYYLRSSRFTLAINPLTTASQLNHNQAEDEYHLALACQGVGDLAHAKQHVQQALRQQDTATLHHLAGDLDEGLGDPLAAVREQERATQLDPSEENYSAWASELLLHRAIWQAIEVFAEGAKAHPASARLKTGWGAALFAGARYDDAALHLCEASDLDPNNQLPYIFLGKVASSSETPAPCIQQRLARFAALAPDSATAAYTYAVYLQKYGGPSQSAHTEGLLRKVVTLDPKSADGYLQLGIIAIARKDYSQAATLLDQAIHADPTLAEAHYRLGVVYDRKGNHAGAAEQFRLHDEAEKTQADATEQQRRDVKQFMIVSDQKSTGPSQP